MEKAKIHNQSHFIKYWFQYIFYSLFFSGIVVLMGYTTIDIHNKRIEKTIINIEYDAGNYFVDEKDLLKTLTENESQQIVGKKYGDIMLKNLELKLENIKFVEDAEISTDHKGNLMIEVKQSKPIARIVRYNAPDAYIGSNATALAVSEKFTAHVLIVNGAYSNRFLQTDYFTKDSIGQNYFKLFQYIEKNPYWNALISECTVLANGDVVLYPQIGDYTIQFGTPVDIENKFLKTNLFFKEILPTKGWGAYSRVNVKFNNQIVCE
jgi:cell division protein FtsQ